MFPRRCRGLARATVSQLGSSVAAMWMVFWEQVVSRRARRAVVAMLLLSYLLIGVADPALQRRVTDSMSRGLWAMGCEEVQPVVTVLLERIDRDSAADRDGDFSCAYPGTRPPRRARP